MNGNTKYDFNKMINIHPFNFKASSCNNRSVIEPHHEEQCKKTEEKYQDDKSLIEFLLGNTNDDSPKKEENKTDKKNKADKKIKNKTHKKMNIHDKRKCIKFNIVKKDT